MALKVPFEMNRVHHVYPRGLSHHSLCTSRNNVNERGSCDAHTLLIPYVRESQRSLAIASAVRRTLQHLNMYKNIYIYSRIHKVPVGNGRTRISCYARRTPVARSHDSKSAFARLSLGSSAVFYIAIAFHIHTIAHTLSRVQEHTHTTHNTQQHTAVFIHSANRALGMR